MFLLNFFGNQREKRREEKVKRGICPECSGRGYFSSGFESIHFQDCNTCLGTGKAIRVF